MTRIPDKQPLPVLDRVKELLQRMHSSDPEIAREWKEPFAPEPCLAEVEIKAWESANAVLLPEEYRQFLLEVGNGGRIPSSYCDFQVWPLAQEFRGLALTTTFPITHKRFVERTAQLRREGRPKQSRLFPELDEYWKVRPIPGCRYFGIYPGGDQVFMVVTGELVGTIWTAVDGGVPECDRNGKPFNFLTWLEDVLLEARTWE